MAFLVGGANSSAADAAYDIENSLRLNDDDAPYLTIASLGSTASDAKKWTVSFWTKLGSMGSHRCFFSVGTYPSPDENSQLNITSVDTLQAYSSTTFGEGGSATNIKTNAVYRDSAAWYHIVWAMDSTESTDTDRIKLYVNGVRVTSFGTANNYPAQNTDNDLVGANSVPHYVGQFVNGQQYNDTYMAEFFFIDGTAYDADDFGETDEDSGIWKPKNASVTFGNNGFFLEFKQTGTDQDSSGIGADTSGNDNHLAVTNLAATDQCTDTPTNNFATLNPLTDATNDLSEGNTVSDLDDGTYATSTTIFAANGKWYAEFKVTDLAGSDAYIRIGVVSAEQNASNLGDGNETYCFLGDGRTYVEGSASSYGSAINTDDIFMVALDTDNNKVWYGINGTWLESGTVGDPAGNSNESHAIDSGPAFGFAIASGSGSYSPEIQCNFGNPAFSISSGNADANGYGNFEYAVPSGFYAVCTKNLAEYG